MSFDPHKNFGYSTVATAPSPATSGTSLTVQSGDGARFPNPSTDGAFNLTVWPTGLAALASNAEIVRCTARSGDTLTIARTQEGTSARTIVVGDQIALTITAKVITDIEATDDPSVILVAAPTGVAATDTAAIAAAITACPAGGVVQLQAATSTPYALTGSPALTISKPLTLRGHGGSQLALTVTDTWKEFGTLLTYSSTTGVAIQITANNVTLENFALQNTGTPTAGAGIQTVTGGGNGTRYGKNLSLRGFYYNIDHQAGNAWIVDPTHINLDFVKYGLRIQNVDDTDGGDATVSGFYYAGPTNNGDTAIYWLSGGGTKIHNAKVNIVNSKTLNIGIALALQDGVETGDFLLVNSSIENCNWGVVLSSLGPSNTGIFTNIVINGNEFLTLGGSSTYSISVNPSLTGKVSAVNVFGNVIVGGSSQYGINFGAIDNASHGPNIFHGVAAGFHDNGNNTNIKDRDSTPPLTTKGDIHGFSTTDARLAVGADGKILAADSAQTLGVGYSTRDLDANSHKITNVTDPASAQDAATKNYVDTHGGGSGTVDGITTVTLVAGSNVTITDNSPSAGDITIAASGSGGSSFVGHAYQASDKSTTGTTYGAGVDLLTTAISFTADGTSDYLVTLSGPGQTNNGANHNHQFILNLDSTQSDLMQYGLLNGTGQTYPVAGRARISAPSAASHTVNVRFFTDGGTATAYAASLGGKIIVTVEKL